MQEDILRPEILESDWFPPEIKGREEQITKLFENIIRPFKETMRIPPSLYVAGTSGSGKTVVVKKVLSDAQTEIKKNNSNFFYYYINVKKLSKPTHFCLIKKIISMMSKDINLGAIPKDYSSNTILEFFIESIKKYKLCLLLVIDEVDKMRDYNDFITIFVDMYLNFSDEPELNLPNAFVGVTTVLISNDIFLLNKIDYPTKTRLVHHIFFPDYDYSEIYQILKYFSTFALNPNKNYDDKIKTVTDEIIGNGGHSIREAKIMLSNYIGTENIEKAKIETEKDVIRQYFKKTTLQEYWVLMSLIEGYKNIGNASKSRNFSEIKNEFKPSTTFFYNIYSKLCPKPKSIRTFLKLIEELKKNQIIDTTYTGLGRGKGTTTLIYPKLDLGVISSLLTENMVGQYGK